MMKKYWIKCLVSLLLCAALLIPAALAYDFTDGDSIGENYRAAVEYMVKLGVLAGYDDGRFGPLDTLTREQGAKIITYIVIGKDRADALTCSAAPYNDVSADRWSAPCIEWCNENGILNGYGNGNFGPVDTLTGYQFAKMLVCALGYGKAETYVNAGGEWAKAVDADARANGLFNLDESMAAEKALERQQAALMAYNALTKQSADPDGTTPAEPDLTTPTDPVVRPDTGSNPVQDPADVDDPDAGIDDDPFAELVDDPNAGVDDPDADIGDGDGDVDDPDADVGEGDIDGPDEDDDDDDGDVGDPDANIGDGDDEDDPDAGIGDDDDEGDPDDGDPDDDVGDPDAGIGDDDDDSDLVTPEVP